jgi:hypothetical protein
MKLMKIDRFRSSFFEPGSAPDPRTVLSWVKSGAVPGKVIGGRCFIDAEKWEAQFVSGADSEIIGLVSKVLIRR